MATVNMDAKVRVTLDTSGATLSPGRGGPGGGKRRRELTKKRAEQIKKEVKKELDKEKRKHKSFQLTLSPDAKNRIGKAKSALGKAAAFAGGTVAIAAFLERFGPAIVREVSDLVVENFAEGGALADLGKFLKKISGGAIDLEAGIKSTVEDILKPVLEKLSVISKTVDKLTAGLDATSQVAEFAHNAALLDRPPSFEKISKTWDRVHQARFAELRTNRFIKREATDRVMVHVLSKASDALVRGMTRL